MDTIDILRYCGALLLVLAMVGGAAAATRHFGIAGTTTARADKRLAVSAALMIGPRQKLLILRRDHVEHLILSSPEGAVVIETGIAVKDPAP